MVVVLCECIFPYIFFTICRQTVEDSYKDLQTQIETQRTDHSITISELTGRMNQARLQHSNMSERVSHIYMDDISASLFMFHSVPLFTRA